MTKQLGNNGKRGHLRTSRGTHLKTEGWQQSASYYFDRVKTDNTILNDLHRRAAMKEPSDNFDLQKIKVNSFCASKHPKQIKSKIYDYPFQRPINTNQIGTAQKAPSKQNEESKLQVVQMYLQDNIERQLKQPGTEYLTYFDYEELGQRALIKASHFEELAKRNDLKREITAQSAKMPPPKNNLISFRSRRVNLTEVHQKKQDRSIQTIISNEIGSLSIGTIRDVLEHRWEEEEILRNKEQIFTQSSEGSEGQTKRVTKKGFHSKDKKCLKINNQVTTPRDRFGPLPNKYAQLLQKINYESSLDGGGDMMPKKDQYSCLEERLMTFTDVYKGRKDDIKHKLDWRL